MNNTKLNRIKSLLIFAIRHFVFLWILSTLITHKTFAGNISFTKHLFAHNDTAVSVGDTIALEADVWSGKFIDKQIQDLVIFGVNHNHNKYYSESFFSKIKIKIIEYDAYGVVVNNFYQYLTIQYASDDTSKKFIDKNIFVFEGAYKYDVVLDSIYINNIPSLELPLNLFLEAQINIERFYNFSSVADVPLTITSGTSINTDCDPENSIDEYEVTWDPCIISSGDPVCPEEYHLEWTFINDYGNDETTYLPASDLHYDFKDNSTRITTTNNSYRITHVFEHGYLMFRVRGIGRDLQNTSIPITGTWSGVNEAGTVNNFNNKIHITSEHEKNKNFQYEAVYAEEGKKKEVVSYFDATLRNRQTVTKINSDKNVIVGQTVYDFQGRPAINALPVPVPFPVCTDTSTEPAFQYYPKFNLDDSLNAYSWNDFDVDSVNNAPIVKTPSMHTSSGAANYYSDDNPDKASANALITDALGYPFSQTEYTPDNTGRIKRQSGVGPIHQLGTEHETIYLYGQPDQIQLDRLFGSEVGDKSHYKKNVVIDPNGQASVNYLDMQGRTIATSLAGDAPKSCDTCNEPRLAGLATEGGALKKLKVDLFAKDANGKSNSNTINTNANSIDFLTHLLVVQQGWYHFNYDLIVGKFNDPCLNTDVCFDCVYDLTISIKDEKGNNFAAVSNEKIINKTVGKFDVDADSNIAFNTHCTSASDFSFGTELDSIFLNPGNYTIKKSLKVNQDAKKYYIKQYFDTTNTHCLKPLKYFEDSFRMLIDTTDCNIDCDVCITALGSRDDFVAQGKGTQFDYDMLLEDCQAPCKEVSWCDAIYQQLLFDVSPDGQYGKYIGDSGYVDQNHHEYFYSDGTVHKVSNSKYFPLSVFNARNQLPKNIITQMDNWKNPSVNVNGSSYSYYLDENGSRSIIRVVPDGNNYIPHVVNTIKNEDIFYNWNDKYFYTYPENLSRVEDFVNRWKDTWAKSLVQYHPEYCYYESCRDYGVKQSNDNLTSDKFDNMLHKAVTFNDALSAGLIKSDYANQFLNINKITDFFTASESLPYDPFAVAGGYFQKNPVAMNFNLHDSLYNKFINYASEVDAYGVVKFYSMVDIAAFATRCGTKYQSFFDESCMKFGTDLYANTLPNAARLNDSIRNTEWNIFKNLYLSAKQHFQYKHLKNLALNYCKGCNECIGNGNFNHFESGMIHSSVYLDQEQPCGDYTASLYLNKTKRFVNESDFATTQNDVEYQIYLQTGQCPVTYHLQFLLNKLASTKRLADEEEEINLQYIPEFSPKLYEEVNGAPVSQDYVNYFWKLVKVYDENTALFAFVDKNGTEKEWVLIDKTEAGIRSWDEIVSIKQLKYSKFYSGYYEKFLIGGDGFEALAQVVSVDDSALTITNAGTFKKISGITSLPLNDCEFEIACKPNDFIQDVENLWSALIVDNDLNKSNFLLPSSFHFYITHNIKNNLKTQSDSLVWNYDASSGSFELYAFSHPKTKLIFNFRSFKPGTYNTGNMSAGVKYFSQINSNGHNGFVVEGRNQFFQTEVLIEGDVWLWQDEKLISVNTGKCDLPGSADCQENSHLLVSDLQALINDVMTTKPNVYLVNNVFKGYERDFTQSPFYTDLIKAYMPADLENATSKYDLFLIDNGARYKEQIYFNAHCECNIILSHTFPVSELPGVSFPYLTRYSNLTAVGETDIQTNRYKFFIIGYSKEDRQDTIWGESCLPLKNCNPCNNKSDSCASCNEDLAITATQRPLLSCIPSFINDTIKMPLLFPARNPCVEQQIQFAAFNAAEEYKHNVNLLVSQLEQRYTQHCLGSVENFTSRYLDKEYHFTLYYYDQVGNLIKTVPPEGVEILDITSFDNPLSIQINNDRTFDKHTVFTNHTLASTYQYNSLGQVVSQSIPDHDNMAIFEITLSNGLDSRLEVTAMQMIDETKGYLTGKINHNGILRGVLYQTSDAAKTWQKIAPVVGADLKKIQMVTGQIAYAVGTHGIALKTIDGGNSWDMLNTYAINFKGHLNDLFFTDADNGIMIGENSAVLKTSNGGNSFSLINIYNDGLIYHLTAITKKGDTYFVSANSYLTDGSFASACVFKSDNGTTWEKQTQFRQQDLLDVSFYSANHAYAAGLNGTLLHTEDGGVSWKVIATNQIKTFAKVIFKNQNEGIALLDSASGYFQLYKTFDAGNTWALMSKPGLYYNDLSLYYNDPGYGAKAVAVGKNGLVQRIILMNNSDFGIIELSFPDQTTDLVSVWAENINNNTFITAVSDNNIFYYTPIGNTDFPSWSSKDISTITSSMAVSIKAKNFEDKTSSMISGTQFSISGVILYSNGKLYSFFKPTGSDVFDFNEISFTGKVIKGISTIGTPLIIKDYMKGLALNNNTDEVYSLNAINNKLYSVKLYSQNISQAATMIPTTAAGRISSMNVNSMDYNSNRIILAGQEGLIFSGNRVQNGYTVSFDIASSTLNIKILPLNDIQYSGSNIFAVGDAGKIFLRENNNLWKSLLLKTDINLNQIKFEDAQNGYIAADNGNLIKININVSNEKISSSEIIPTGTIENLRDLEVLGSKLFVIGDNRTMLHSADISREILAQGIYPKVSKLYGITRKPGTSQMLVAAEAGNMMLWAGTSLTNIKEIYTPPLKDVHFIDANNGTVCGNNYTLRQTHDGGNSWNVIVSDDNVANIVLNRVWTINDKYALAIGDASYLSEIKNDKAFTIPSSNFNTSGFALTSIKFQPNNSLSGFIGNQNNKVFGIILSGSIDNFTISINNSIPLIQSPSNRMINDIEVFQDGGFLAVGSLQTLQYNKGYGGGFQWVDLAPGTIAGNSILTSIDFYDKQNAYVVGDNGIFLKADNISYDADGFVTGISWIRKNVADNYNVSANDNVNLKAIEYTSGKTSVFGGSYNISNATTSPYVRLLYEEDKTITSRFWYDKLGREIVTQNSKQFNQALRAYSYKKYDNLGRVIESGQKLENHTSEPQFFTIFGTEINNHINPGMIDEKKYLNWLNSSGKRTEVVKLFYDEQKILSGTILKQENLRNRIASTTIEDEDDGLDNTYNHAVHYGYDLHGNVKTLLQDNAQISIARQRYKKVDYEYDLISGKVNSVHYQDNQSDQFHHKYEYDADNRITDVYTSKDKILWDHDAKYFYYPHGPLARIEYGDNHVQGMDYAYTLQGWVKAVNSETLENTRDIGNDGNPATGNLNQHVAKDAFGYSLTYFENDYQSIGTSGFLADKANSDLLKARNDLFNGNITAMVTTITNPLTGEVLPQGTAYKYDQLNRLIESKAFTNMDAASNVWQGGSTYNGMYHNKFTYDGNGNILTQLRNDQNGVAVNDLTYNRMQDANGKLKQNRLYWVNDAVDKDIFTDDIDDQQSGNYAYDEIGNLISNNQKEIQEIKYTVYGKVKEVIRTAGSNKKSLKFDYDATGNRTAKHIYSSAGVWEKSEYYARDAQGNVMSIYKQENDATTQTQSFAQTEKPIYGSTRIGTEKTKVELIGTSLIDTTQSARVLGNKEFEGSNHLGNVLTTFTDRKIPIDVNNDGTIDEYWPHIISSTDYYPFGVAMKERSFGDTASRYHFNGKEFDRETGTSDFDARMQDGDLGVWHTVDQLFKEYSEFSPYNFALNTPIQAKDPDGNVVIFINGQHAGDGGRSEYWNGFDKKAMKAIGDYSARYYDGGLGGWANTVTNAGLGALTGSRFGWVGSTLGAAIRVFRSSNVNMQIRIAAGYAMGKAQAADIINNLEEGESIKIVTHSFGPAYSRGFVQALNDYAKENNLTINIEYQVDIAAFDGENLPILKDARGKNIVGKSQFMSGDADWVANPAEAIGIGESSDIPGAERIKTEKGTGHGIGNFMDKARKLIRSNNNNSATEDNPKVWEENPVQENGVNLLLLLSMFSTLIIGGCKTKGESKEKMIPLVDKKEYKRDSLYLFYTVREFMEAQYESYHYYKTFSIPIEEVKISIDSVFYSPDRLRIFAFVIEEIPDYEDGNPEKTFFGGDCLIGFRDSISQAWRVYPFDEFSISALSTYEKTHESFRKFYFTSFQYHIESVLNYDSNYGGGIDKKSIEQDKWMHEATGSKEPWKKSEWAPVFFGYNLNEPEFWTKSIAWQKGACIPGYYNFQLKYDNCEPGDEKKCVISYLEINYPQELLEQFK